MRFEKRTQEAAQLKMELDKAQETIAAAETLVGKLDGEFKRWSGQVREFFLIFIIRKQLGDLHYVYFDNQDYFLNGALIYKRGHGVWVKGYTVGAIIKIVVCCKLCWI